MTLSADLYDEARKTAEALALSTAQFISIAIREKVSGGRVMKEILPRLEAAKSTPHAEPSHPTGPVTPPNETLSSAGEVRPVPPADARDRRSDPKGSTGPAGGSFVSAPPSTSSPEVEVAPGKREERAAGDAAAASRSPRPEAEATASPSTTKSVSSPRDDSEISTWTCPICNVTMPLLERWSHKEQAHPTNVTIARATGRESGGSTDVGAVGERRVGPYSPSSPKADATANPVAQRRHQKESIVIARLKGFATDAGRTKDPFAYMVEIVKRAYVDGGYEELPDQDARELVLAIAAKEPAIERVLDSMSTRSPSTKGGERGR